MIFSKALRDIIACYFPRKYQNQWFMNTSWNYSNPNSLTIKNDVHAVLQIDFLDETIKMTTAFLGGLSSTINVLSIAEIKDVYALISAQEIILNYIESLGVKSPFRGKILDPFLTFSMCAEDAFHSEGIVYTEDRSRRGKQKDIRIVGDWDDVADVEVINDVLFLRISKRSSNYSRLIDPKFVARLTFEDSRTKQFDMLPVHNDDDVMWFVVDLIPHHRHHVFTSDTPYPQKMDIITL